MKRSAEKNQTVMPKLRLYLCAVLAVLLASNLVGLFHMATVRHSRCLEHGELIHVETNHPHSSAGLAAFHFQTEDSAVKTRPTPVQPGHSHQHCAVTVVCRQQIAAAPIVDSIDHVESVSPTGLLLLSDDPARSVAVYIVAPKHSPPVSFS